MELLKRIATVALIVGVSAACLIAMTSMEAATAQNVQSIVMDLNH